MTPLFRSIRNTILLACLFVSAWVQADSFLVQPVPISGKDTQGEPYGKAYGRGKIVMPFVRAATPSGEAAARRINEMLFITLTGALPPRQLGASFVVNGSEELTGTTTQEFTVPRNDARILGIDLDIEGCGAYCENYTRQFSFEAATGRLLTPQNLFTPAGQRALAARVTAERISQYRAQLRAQRAELKKQQAAKKAGKPTTEVLDDIEVRITLNEDCLAELTDKSRQSDTPPEQVLANYQQAAGSKSYDITAGRCSNHAMRALDDVGDVTLSLPYGELAPHLTPFGKAVLLGDASAPAEPADPFMGQVLHGLLTPSAGNAIPITLLVNEQYGSLQGTYFYDRIGKPILLSGHVRGKQIELREQPAEGKPAATFTLTRSGNSLKGVWSGVKQFPVVLGN